MSDWMVPRKVWSVAVLVLLTVIVVACDRPPSSGIDGIVVTIRAA